jgi:hypothetical protein
VREIYESKTFQESTSRLGDEIRGTSDRSTFVPFFAFLPDPLSVSLPALVSIFLSRFANFSLFDMGRSPKKWKRGTIRSRQQAGFIPELVAGNAFPGQPGSGSF